MTIIATAIAVADGSGGGADVHRVAVRIESFDFAEDPGHWLRLGAGFPIQSDDARAALKHVDRQTWEGLTRAACWQSVAGSCKEVPHGNGRVVPEEDGACGSNHRQNHVLALGDERQVLWREGIHQSRTILQGRREHRKHAFFQNGSQH